MPIIEMDSVSKIFKIKKRHVGALHGLRDFFNAEYIEKIAVDNISFQINPGELVGYIGPNGAGKSTTLKMLTGILVPSKGRVLVNGYEPYKNRKKNALGIGAVFGQRSQLLWDLPVKDTLELYQKMYRIEKERYKRNCDEFIELLDMKSFINQPARQLSLGQKMKANIALALLYDPAILYLDEPTIGLDVVAKQRIRVFVRNINRTRNTTVILTTHDMTDIETICDRLILIDNGKKLYDDTLESFKMRNAPSYILNAVFAQAGTEMDDPRFHVLARDGASVKFELYRNELKPGEAITLLASSHELIDIKITETPVEDIVCHVYNASPADKGECGILSCK